MSRQHDLAPAPSEDALSGLGVAHDLLEETTQRETRAEGTQGMVVARYFVEERAPGGFTREDTPVEAGACDQSSGGLSDNGIGGAVAGVGLEAEIGCPSPLSHGTPGGV